MEYLLIILFLIGVHGVFVATEYSIVKTANCDFEECLLSPYQDVFRNLEEYLLICQIGKTLALMSMGACLGLLFRMIILEAEQIFSIKELTISSLAFFGVVVVQLVLGFELPKLLGVVRSDKCVVALAGYLRLCKYFFHPMTWAVKRLRILTP